MLTGAFNPDVKTVSENPGVSVPPAHAEVLRKRASAVEKSAWSGSEWIFMT